MATRGVATPRPIGAAAGGRHALLVSPCPHADVAALPIGRRGLAARTPSAVSPAAGKDHQRDATRGGHH